MKFVRLNWLFILYRTSLRFVIHVLLSSVDFQELIQFYSFNLLVKKASQDIVIVMRFGMFVVRYYP